MFSPQTLKEKNVWRLIKGQICNPMLYYGVKKVLTKPTTLSKTILDNYETLLIDQFPDGFGVIENVFSRNRKMIVQYYNSGVIGDLIVNHLYIISDNAINISVDDGSSVKMPLALMKD